MPYTHPSTETLSALETAPNMYLILSPDLFILTASDLYLEATQNKREVIVGKHIFEAFPDNPELPDADGVQNINASLQEVLRTKKRHVMRIQRYDVPDIDRPGKFIQRYWDPSHTPIFDQDGNIHYIIQLATNVTEKVLADEALAEQIAAHRKLEISEKHFRQLADIVPAKISNALPSGEVTFFNQKWLDYAGMNFEDLRDFGYYRMMHPDEIPVFQKQLAEAAAKGVALESEMRFKDISGNYRWHLNIASPVKNEQGEITMWVGSTTDIQRIKEEELRKNDLQQLINMLPASVVVIRGDDLVVEMINQSNLNYWKKTADEVIGRPFLEILPDLADQPFAGQLRQVMATGESIDVKESPVLFENADGTTRETFVDYTYQALTDTDGERNGVLVMSFEITDRVLARRQVEQSEKNLKAMIEQAPVAMCILSGPEHAITVANQLMVELWGKPQDEVMNKPVFEALPDARGQGLEVVMENVFSTGETFYAKELPVSLIRHGEPDIVYQNFVYQAYRGADGTIGGIIAITIDVTEQVLARKTIERSEAELRDIKSRLEAELAVSRQVERQKDDFIGMASHELKTPLTSLNALLQVAQAKLKNSEDRFLTDAMDKSNIQVKRMTAMINGFLNISRLESGKIHIEKQEFEIAALINEMIAEAQLTISTHIITFDSCPGVRVFADREKIGSVISNLISNAVKYSPKGRNISVACHKDTGYLTVSVKDEGMGIKAADLEKIFDRYYRVDAVQTQHIAGFGIGLYLSAEIVRRHSGRIWAESESGAGSVFYFSLPLRHGN